MTSMTGNMDVPPSPGVPRLPETKLDLSLSFDSFIPPSLFTDPEVDTKYATPFSPPTCLVFAAADLAFFAYVHSNYTKLALTTERERKTRTRIQEARTGRKAAEQRPQARAGKRKAQCRARCDE